MNTPGKKRLRILHAPIVALSQPLLYIRGLRELGHKADYMVFDIGREAHTLQGSPEYNLKIGEKRGKLRRLGKFFAKSLFNYDIFHFHSGWSLMPPMDVRRGLGRKIRLLASLLGMKSPLADFAGPDMPVGMQLADLKFLKRLGKKIVFQWWGCDIRIKEFYDGLPHDACRVCGPTVKEKCDSDYKRLLKKVTQQFADANLSSGDLCATYPDFRWMSNAIDVSTWHPVSRGEIPEKFRLPINGKLKIYHSFSHSDWRGDIKGSTFVRETVKRLQDDGFNIELIFFDGVPNLDVRYYQAQANIVVESLRRGAYGSTGIECMAMGLPTIGYIRDDVAKLAPEGLPIVRATPDNLYDVMRDLILDEDKRLEIGRKSREFAEKHFSHTVVAGKLVEMYRSL